MVTWNKVVAPSNGGPNGEGVLKCLEGVCLSTDTKPTGVGNGSRLMEMDTSTLYIYDAANSTWRAWS